MIGFGLDPAAFVRASEHALALYPCLDAFRRSLRYRWRVTPMLMTYGANRMDHIGRTGKVLGAVSALGPEDPPQIAIGFKATAGKLEAARAALRDFKATHDHMAVNLDVCAATVRIRADYIVCDPDGVQWRATRTRVLRTAPGHPFVSTPRRAVTEALRHIAHVLSSAGFATGQPVAISASPRAFAEMSAHERLAIEETRSKLPAAALSVLDARFETLSERNHDRLIGQVEHEDGFARYVMNFAFSSDPIHLMAFADLEKAS